MKRYRDLTRIVVFILSFLLLPGMIPALATEAGTPITGDNLLSELEAANSAAQLFLRHASEHRHEDLYSRGELFFLTDLYATAKSVCYCFGEDSTDFVTPTV